MNKELKLLKYIESRIGLPFEFGVNDCPLFITGCVDAMYDTKLRNKYLGKWVDKKTAWKYSRKHGEIQDHFKAWGCVSVEINFMQTGDIIIMSQELAHSKSWKSAAIYTGSKVAIMTLEGLKIVTIKELMGVKEVLRWQAY